eukprot:scaffold77192_cov37-Cyclotella_meneghiniana.AAC.6
MHRMHVCLICDCFIIGKEKTHWIRASTVQTHGKGLSVLSYEHFQNVTLHPNVVRENEVTGLEGLLLSRRATQVRGGYSCCVSCYNSLRNTTRKDEIIPKFAIANGFAIGSFPSQIKRTSCDDEHNPCRTIDEDIDPNESIRALVPPIRPYGYVFAYTGGSHQSIRGHYQFYEMDQAKLGGAVN